MTVEVGLGVFSGEWHSGTGLDHTQTLAESIQQVVHCEEVGLDSVWISEHHFHAASFVGSLAAYAGAMVQATKRIKVGYGLALAPLHDPVKMAEDAAFLDVLSGGRFEMGLGIGYRDVEFTGFGGTSRQRVGRTLELIDICRQAWADGEIDHVGTHYTRRGFSVTPKPIQSGGPPIMMGGHHPNAIDRAARLGDRFCMDAGTDSESYEEGTGRNRGLLGRVEGTLGLYREALRRHGRDDSQPHFSLNVGGFLHPDGRDAAWDVVAEAYMMTRRVYGDWYGLDPQEYADWTPERLTAEEVEQRKSELLLGSVDQVYEVLTQVHELVGDNLAIMFRSKYPLVTDADTRVSIEQLAELRDRLRA